MRTLATWIRYSVGKTVGLLLVLMAIMGVIMIKVPPELNIIVQIIAIFVLFPLIIKILTEAKINRQDIEPICGEGRKLYLNNSKRILELRCRDVRSVKGKSKKFHRASATYSVSGEYNYGKVIVKYLDSKGRIRKFVIRNIHNPEQAAWRIERYIEFHSLKCTEKIKSIFG